MSVLRTPSDARNACRSGAPQGGFTIVEALLGLVTLALASTAVMQGVAISAHAVEQTESCAIALEAAEGLADRIAATPIDDVFGIWGPDGSEGPDFEIDGFVGIRPAKGTIRIVTDETETDPDLRAAFGLPRDLDGDGGTTTTDVSATARILPVLIEVTWGRGADQRIRLPVIVVREE